MYVNSEKYYFGIISEPYGTKDGYSYKGLQAAIVANAANATGQNPNEIPILGAESEIKGFPGVRSITYNPTISGTPFIFHNIFKVYPDKAVQFIFWGVGKSLSLDFKSKIDEAILSIKIN